jgi:integrase
MIENTATVGFVIEGTKANKDGKYPVKLNIYFGEGKKKYGIKEAVTKDEWEKVFSPNLRDAEIKKLKARLKVIETKAQKILDNLHPFSIVAFEEAFFQRSPLSGEQHLSKLAYWFDRYIKTLKENGQIGTAISYQTTINSITEFKKNLTIYDITPEFLQSYENHMTKAGKSTSSIGIYMRQLRAIINQAIDNNMLSADKYPFKKYQIPAGRNIKKALPSDDLQKLLDYTTTEAAKQKAIDFWIFSYLCNGINFTDIAHLKPENLDGNYINFYREKTKRTKKKDLRPIKVGLNPRVLEIINRQKNTDPENPYLFPILEAGLNPVTVKHRCQRFIKWVNKHMEDIRVEKEIAMKIGTYAARHSFSTVLKRKGASTSFIKESLGHSSEITTEGYLDSFTDDVKLEFANLLTQLK